MPSIIRRFFLRHLRKMRSLPPKIYTPISYEYYTGKKLNLKNPIEFNEKLQWMKVYYHPKVLTQLVDKYAVRAYVEEKIGAQYLNQIYGVYDKPEAIPFENLPNKFVVKATHTSSHNLIVTDKTKLNKKKAIKLFYKWLGKNQYYRIGQEWAYKDVPPRLIVEKFLKDDDKNSLIDYKFYCFNGTAKFLEVHLDRADNHKRGFYDFDFKLLPFRYVSLEKSISSDIKKPRNLNEMIKFAEILSAKFPFVRVDFYSIKGKTIFGEMTFYPSDGRKDFIPEKYNKIIGDYISIPKLESGQQAITKTD
ncbi:ATP-grasp fold amidoligase family protein [Winogradskyella bathintestinalis]|uniref:ATP-grasp fold amidoligase family protein n=1 Tax=Winogradskyella bathintestinalis TaxID=3035208 RepID=A0ABT7ZWP2_9FLAO|nr:ATP-grasp fold amidoligase family protein [Winogradskyella bathintestinalis]MDN3493428.1 ATP-grasp fold amidoligase family protein [Winogradskyella bathintestinalis]